MSVEAPEVAGPMRIRIMLMTGHLLICTVKDITRLEDTVKALQVALKRREVGVSTAELVASLAHALPSYLLSPTRTKKL